MRRTLVKSVNLFYGMILENKIAKILNLLHPGNLRASKICTYMVIFQQSHKILQAQNVTGAYVIIMLVYRRLLTMSSCVIVEKQQKLFVQGHNLEVHDVNKAHAKTCVTVTNYITYKPGFCVT